MTWQRFLTHEQRRTLSENVDRVLKSRHPSVDPEWIQHIHTLKEGKWLHDFADNAVTPLVSQLLEDEEPVLYSSQIASRAPQSKERTPWHQDGAGAGLVTFWIALDRVTSQNGGLQVVPGAHHGGRLRLKRLDSKKCDIKLSMKMALHNVRFANSLSLPRRLTHTHKRSALIPYHLHRNDRSLKWRWMPT